MRINSGIASVGCVSLSWIATSSGNALQSVFPLVAPHQIRQRAGDQRILLHEARALTRTGRIVGVEHAVERFGFQSLGHGAHEVTVGRDRDRHILTCRLGVVPGKTQIRNQNPAFLRWTFRHRRGVHRATAAFGSRRVGTLLFSKFVIGLDAVSAPLAGATGLSPLVFVGLDAIGAGLWTACYVGLGDIFSNQLDRVAMHLARFGTVDTLAVTAAFAFYPLRRLLHWHRLIRYFHIARITPIGFQPS